MGKYAVILFLAGLLYSPARLNGQTESADPALDRPLRMEIPVGSDHETYRVIPCSSDGVLLFYKSIEEAGEGKVKWYFTLYDKNLQPLWTKGVTLGSGMEFREDLRTGDTLALFFHTPVSDKPSAAGFQLLRVALASGTFILNQGEWPADATLAAFRLAGTSCFAALNIKGEQAQLMILDLPTGKLNLVPVTGAVQTNVALLETDPAGSTLTAIVRHQLAKRYWDHYLVRWNTDGTRLGESLIATLKPERQIAEPEIIHLPEGGLLIAGTYALTTATPDPGAPKGIPPSAGYFASRFEGMDQKNVRFSNFLDFSTASRFVTEREMMSLRKKAVKKNRPVTEFSTDQNLLLHDIVRWDDQYILMGEFYNLQYHSEAFTDYDFYGRPYSNSYSVFDGYRFTDAVLAAFDTSGKLLWDQCIEIRDLLTQELTHKFSLTFFGQDAVAAFLSNGKIGYSVFRRGEVIEKPEYTDVEMLVPEDRLVSETRSRLLPWYETYYICCGYQEIRNIANPGNPSRTVYYLSKVKF